MNGRKMYSELRASKRFVFPNDSDAKVVLESIDGSTLEAKVLNVSTGGLGLAASRNLSDLIKKEGNYVLKDFSGHNNRLSCLSGKKLVVRWVIDFEQLNNLGFGCEFMGLDSVCKEEVNLLLTTM